MAAIVALHKRLKSRFMTSTLPGADKDDVRSESSDTNAGAVIDEEFEDSNALLGVMPTPSNTVIHGLLHKIDYRGEWSLRQGLYI
jgi:hypothetical protein